MKRAAQYTRELLQNGEEGREKRGEGGGREGERGGKGEEGIGEEGEERRGEGRGAWHACCVLVLFQHSTVNCPTLTPSYPHTLIPPQTPTMSVVSPTLLTLSL